MLKNNKDLINNDDSDNPLITLRDDVKDIIHNNTSTLLFNMYVILISYVEEKRNINNC